MTDKKQEVNLNILNEIEFHLQRLKDTSVFGEMSEVFFIAQMGIILRSVFYKFHIIIKVTKK